MDAVGHVLALREQDTSPWGPAVALAFLLHGGILAAFLLSSLAHPLRYVPTRSVAVRLVQAGTLAGGSAAPESPPPRPEKPKITKPAEEEPPPPTEKAKLLPAKEEKKRPQPSAAQAPAAKHPSTPSGPPSRSERPGAGALGAGGDVGIGGATFDQPDFNYSYYIERMLVTIGTNWFKPALTVPTSPIIRFRILRDGTIADAEVERTSGLPFVDRAALRAVLASSPLPPLPAEFGSDHLGVHLIFE
jgi:periplasmic protein TonB